MLRCLLLTSLAAVVLAKLEPQPRYLKDGLERVVGGDTASPNSWPWQISLQYKLFNNYYHTCGGTLIAKGWVMTAAHCVDSPRQWRVILGGHDLANFGGTEQVIAVSKAHIHPLWNPEKLDDGNDIALLQLASEAALNANVQLGTLPPSGLTLPHNNLCYITGWGRTSTGGPLPDKLKQAYLPVVGHETCRKPSWWGSTLSDNVVCAGGGAESGCNGDSGGPLNCLVDGKFDVYGIASFVSSKGCNALQKPTVFTRVSAYIDWINSIMV